MKEFLSLIDYFFGFLKKEQKAFFLYSLSYAVLGLIIPFAVQVIVNQLALTGLRQSLLTLGIIVGLGLALFCFLKLTQIILLEYVQRKIKIEFLRFFQKNPQLDIQKKWYYFEITAVQNKIGSWAMNGFELVLTICVGLIVLSFYHPMFLILSVYIVFVIWVVCLMGTEGLQTSLEVCTKKYKIFKDISNNTPVGRDLASYFTARHRHFIILKKQAIVLLIAQWIGQMSVLFGGLALVQRDELGLGQFVAAEIIASSIFISLNKAPKFIENHFDLLTSLTKLHGLQSEK